MARATESDAALLATPSVLVVDDETGIRELMARWLASGGYAVRTAASASEALARVHDTAPAVALCDIRMPGRDGLWLANQIRRDAPETAVIMATGVPDVEPAVTSLRQGVIDYLTKPFGPDRLRESVSRGLDWHKAARDARRWRESARRGSGESAPPVVGCADGAHDRLRCGARRLAVGAHAGGPRCVRARLSCRRSCRERRLRDGPVGPEDMEALERAALLHDVGKLAMPEAVLRKPAPLTTEEQAVIRQHPQIASDLIAGVPYLSAAAELVRDAHERVDGLGYPNGTHASDVALGARIIAVADAFDTMTRPRVFRDAVSTHEAMMELERCAGTQFDAGVVLIFKKMLQT